MDIIGGLSGAALGYITGNVRGARLGYTYGKQAGKSFRNKMAPLSTKRKATSVSKVTKRRKVEKKKSKYNLKKVAAALTAAGKKIKKVKSNRRRSKRAASKVAAIVQKTLDKNVTINTYRKNYFMDQKVAYDRSDMQLFIVGGRRQNDNTAPYTLKALQFTPLSVEKIADACAVLWNGKAANMDASVETGNFPLSKTTVHLVYGSYTLRLKNFSPTALDIEVIEVTNKDTYNSDNFFANAAFELPQNNLVAVNYNTPPLFIDTAGDNQWALTKGLKFTDLTGMSDSYSWKVIKRKRLLHGAEMKLKYQLADRKIDLSEFSHGGGLMADYCRGDKQIIFKVTPVIHGIFKDVDVTVPMCGSFQTIDAVNRGLVFHCSEVFKIAQPSNTADANEGHKIVMLSDEPIIATYGYTNGAAVTVNEPREVAATFPTAVL